MKKVLVAILVISIVAVGAWFGNEALAEKTPSTVYQEELAQLNSSTLDLSAIEGDHFNLYAYDGTLAWGDLVFVSAVADAEKDAYITGASCGLQVATANDYNCFLYADLLVYDATDDVILARSSGLGGVFMTFLDPLVIPAGHSFSFIMRLSSDIACNGWVSGWGYD